MFLVGVVLLLMGCVFVYGSRWIARRIGKEDPNRIVMIKMIGMLLTFLAFGLIFLGEFPRTLEFIRIFNR